MTVSQCASADHRAALQRHGMSRRDCCYGNAVAENFWHVLQVELIR